MLKQLQRLPTLDFRCLTRLPQNISITSISGVTKLFALKWRSQNNNSYNNKSDMTSKGTAFEDLREPSDNEFEERTISNVTVKAELSDENEKSLILKEHNEGTEVNLDSTKVTEEIPEEEVEEKTISKEERYQQLQKLLTCSKFYTQYLQKKIQDHQAARDIAKECQPKVKNENDNPETEFEFNSPTARRGKRRRIQHYPSIKKHKTDVEAKAEAENQQPNLLTGGTMRQYQWEGFRWLKVLFENGINGILGDEMGLGKTIQCIALIAHLIENKVTGPFLVCAPLSTLPNWQAEFKRFTPKIPILVYHGSKKERAAIRSKINKMINIGGYLTCPVVVTSYEMIIKDHVALGKQKWKYLVIDEGHRIKNSKCLLIQHLRRIPCLSRLLLTGTPLQNNLAELWSLLNFLLPEVFDNLQVFESWFDVSELCKEGGDEHIVQMERENHIVSALQEILSPFLLRRLKVDVELMIPPKKELIVMAPLTRQQQNYYKDIVSHTINILPKQAENEVLPLKRGARRTVESEQRFSEINIKMANIMMQLRKCCNHPYLLEYPIDPATNDYKIDQDVIDMSGKLMVMDALIERLIEKGHKILVFSQMVKMLEIFHDYCYLKNYDFCRLDGSMSLEERQEAIDEFNNNPEVRLFFLSTRAGGLGLNLTAADTVIIYDSDWNPQCDLQAMDRCHRIGQTKPVIVYRLVTAGTIDQQIVERATAKRKLEKMIIHKNCFKNAEDNYTFRLNPTELLQLLKSSDHDGVIHFSKQVFTNAEWDFLLDRSFSAQDANKNVSSRVKILEN